MQVAHSFSNLVALPLADVVVELPLSVVVELPLPVVVELPLPFPKLATVGELDPPPHAASAIAAAATRIASPADRR
jgi:hypothetical protein